MGRTHIKAKGATQRNAAGLLPAKAFPMPHAPLPAKVIPTRPPPPLNTAGYFHAHFSTASSVASMAPPPPPPPVRRIPAPRAAKQKAKPIVRTHSDMLKAVAESRKKGKAKRRAYNTHPRKIEDVWVYVSNLSADVTEDALWAHFSGCGKIASVELRLTGALQPGSAAADTAYVYGVIQFKTPGAARAAVRLDGSILRTAGFPHPIVVEAELGDLPEVHRANDRLLHRSGPEAHMATYQTATGVTTPSPLKPQQWMIEKTKIWKPTEEDKRKVKRAHGKRFVVDGISFSMTVA
ncbi:hypothetical protein C8R43DRAFT_1194897 [Mycena crocata]|nr:hypothetical protein C8R43DRAFT_1194897 [Mycena crocata]